MMDKYLTVREAAEMMRVKPVTVYFWVSSGRLSCLRAGGRVLFRKETIRAFVGDTREEGGGMRGDRPQESA